MSGNRVITALAAIVIGGTLLSGCGSTGPADPTVAPTTASATPTSTARAEVPPPADEDEAISAAGDTIERILAVQSEVNAAGGVDVSRYDDLAMGAGLDYFQANAQRIAQGPLANEDGVNVDGQASTEGIIVFEPATAYGQDSEGTANGLVILPGCMDISGYTITTADGKPAYRPDSDRNRVEFQVTYDTGRKLWLVSNLIDFPGETC